MSQVADGTGDVWTYAYDAAGHLLSVTAPGPKPDDLLHLRHRQQPRDGQRPACRSPTPTARSRTSPTMPCGRLTRHQRERRGADATHLHLPGRGRGRRPPTRAGDQTIVWYNDLGLAVPRPGSAGRHFHLPLRQQRQPGQLHRRGRRHLPVHLRLQRQPDQTVNPLGPDRQHDLRLR